MSGAVAGVDLGGTKVQAVRVEGCEVAGQSRRSTPAGGPDDVVAAVVACVREVGEVEAVGLGAPGMVDADAGVVLAAPNLVGFDRPVELAARVAMALGLDRERVSLDNDVNVAALAEHRLGAGRGVDDLLVVFVGTGVGAGLVLDGQLRRGRHGFAGELGHTTVVDGGRRCGCGGLGHLEAYAGRGALEREARERAAAGTRTRLVELVGEGRMKSKTFARAVSEGDELAVALVEEAVVALGIALANVHLTVDLQRIVLGGGLADRLGDPFVTRVATASSARSALPTVPDIVPGELGDLAGARGAALLVVEGVTGDPGRRSVP